MTWTSDRIRETFLEFYAAREHRRVSSLPLIPPGDPTLLFTNAGMVQFKDVFTGKRRVDYGAACSSQKCLRVSGKHNDLENVGRTARHHTFFEMLGNFSFGPYFKEGAISTAWELLTKVYGLPTHNLYVTVHPDDAEARDLWTRVSGLPPERILNDPENFWSMGDTGPCGPCSEIHVDQGAALSGGVEVPFGQGGDRYLEIWNLVFMQYDRDESGKLTPLPRPCIDTGMGLERITAILQGKQSNYDSDLFQPIIQSAAKRAGTSYGQDDETDVALRVIADHSRAAAFLVADGVYPENEGRGYVIRRVMRRAMRFGRKLGLTEPFLVDTTAEVVRCMGSVYPELLQKADVIRTVVRQEEERFGRTLEAGLKRLEETFSREAAAKVVPGDVAFELYDTYGFPLDMTEQAAGEAGFAVDVRGFDEAMEAQRAKGRASWKGATLDDTAWEALRDAVGTSKFVGYEQDEAQGRVLAVVPVQDGVDAVVTDVTPFYAESGGQVGDTGTIRTSGGTFAVSDTQSPLEGVIIHKGRFTEGRFAAGAPVTLAVDTESRNLTRKNHSATHLLHFALRKVLGDHVKQRGSLVGPHRLRFDFSHFKPVSPGEIRQIELLVNERVVQNVPARTDVLPKEQAASKGAIAFFGEKYGDVVRVLTITPDSVEFCGGTHVRATGDIGLVKVVGETSVGAGVRRIEALTGLDALTWIHEREELLAGLGAQLKVGTSELQSRVTRLLEEAAETRREIESLRATQRSAGLGDARPERVGSVDVLAMSLDGVAMNELRDLADKAREKVGSGLVLVTSGSVFVLAATSDLAGSGLDGREIVKRAGGRGGGRPELVSGSMGDKSASDFIGVVKQAIREVRP